MKNFIEATSDCKGKGKIKRCINCDTITLFFPLETAIESNNPLNKARICFVDGTYIDTIETYDELVSKISIWQRWYGRGSENE